MRGTWAGVHAMSIERSKLIADEHPLLIFPSLARCLGLQEGLLLQQLHYWLHLKAQAPGRYTDHFKDGRYWVHWTLQELREHVPFGSASLDPYKRVTRGLREQGILLVRQYGSAWDKTNWYSIDYDAFDRAVGAAGPGNSSGGGNATARRAEVPPIERRMPRPSKGGRASDDCLGTETSTKTTTTTKEVVVVDAPVPTTPATLDLSGLPARLHAGVAKRLAGMADGPSYVRLLTKRMREAIENQKVAPLQNELLWLDRLLAHPDRVDFSAVAREVEREQAEESARQRAAEQATKAAEEQQNAEMQLLHRAMAAQKAIDEMSPEARAELALIAQRNCQSPKASFSIGAALAEGRVPAAPYHLVILERALQSHAVLDARRRGSS